MVATERREIEPNGADPPSERDSTRPGQPARETMRAPRVSVVIPALNEARNLPHVLGALPKDVYEVVLVDGDSADRTMEIARELFPEIRLVRQTGRGKGDALACGFAVCRGEIIVTLDADGSGDPAEIGRFVNVLRTGADFAKGSRFLQGGGSADITHFRALGNAVLTLLVNALFGVRYSDLCYGYNAFWTRYLPYLKPDSDGFEIETLINLRAARVGLRVAEVPSFEGQRIHGVSNLIAVPDGWRVLKTILRERFRHDVRPVPPEVREAHSSWNGAERRSGADRRAQQGSQGGNWGAERRRSFGRRATDFRPMPEVLTLVPSRPA